MSEHRGPRWARAAAAAAVVVLVLVAGSILLHQGSGARGPDRAAGGAAGKVGASARVARATTLAARACRPATRGFVPTSVSIPGVTRRAGVVTPPRDAAGVPGTPPLTSAGKQLFAWDLAQGTRPGDRRGNVLLNAHAWPDGSALGNRMVARLHRGDRIVVRGQGHRLCYRVTERVVVAAADGLPRYYARAGRPRLALLTCSGRRLGPGVWTQRTIWFASPVV